MYFLFSGEGPTDLGRCRDNTEICQGENYEPGPMAVIVDQIVENRDHYSLLEAGCYRFVPRSTLVDRASELKPPRKDPKEIRLPGKKRDKETQHFFNNARALARIAKEWEAQLSDDAIVAVLFRDSDGTASAGRGLWQEKRQSMVRGFAEEGFQKGVPMIPKPKSEAWIICAVKVDPYHGCNSLEDRSGNDNAPNSLKGELAGILGGLPSREELCEMVTNRSIDWCRIEMPSFVAFREALTAVL